MATTYIKRSQINAPAQDLFAYHEAEGAFKRLNPPWEPVEVVVNDGNIQDGARVELKINIGPIPQYLRLIHRNYRKNEGFEDHMVSGPFAEWRHQHGMIPNGENLSILEDRIDYTLPMGILGNIFGGRFAYAKLERMFNYRHEITLGDMEIHQQYKNRPRLTVAITGSSGLIGSQLVPFLTTGGHTVKRLVRHQPKNANEIYWNPQTGELNPADLADVDVVIHLAGEGIADKRWTEDQKRKILDSRIQGTGLIAKTLATMPANQRPNTLITASAIGYYGERGDELLTEDMPSGEGFQAEVCRAWEGATQPAIDAGVRVVTFRLGIVLALQGGALRKMLPPFMMGVGGILGSGKQYMSWIALDDILGIFHHAMMTPDMQGIYNATAPTAVTNHVYTKTLGKVINRPTIFPVPSIGLRVMFGKLADELLLSSTRVDSSKLTKTGYQFRYSDLESALRHVLGRK